MRTRSIILVLAAGLTGCASGPYAYLDDDFRGKRTDPDLFPIALRAVDGQFRGIRPMRVDPGDHVVVAVSMRPQRPNAHDRQLAFEFRAEACVHYYLAAKHRDRLSEEWEPVVLEQRPIAGCDEETETD